MPPSLSYNSHGLNKFKALGLIFVFVCPVPPPPPPQGLHLEPGYLVDPGSLPRISCSIAESFTSGFQTGKAFSGGGEWCFLFAFYS